MCKEKASSTNVKIIETILVEMVGRDILVKLIILNRNLMKMQIDSCYMKEKLSLYS